MRLLEVSALCAGYGPVTVLDKVGFSIEPGGKTALLGRNGAGKSTLARALMGLVGQHAGSIRFNGKEIAREPTAQRARLGLGYVPQTRDIFASLTVIDNLRLGCDRPDAREMAFGLFPRLAERRAHLGSELSGGEQQMLAIARVLIARPKLLLLDEPLEGLAPLLREDVMNALDRYCRENAIGALMAEQQIGHALAFTEQTLIMERGRIVWSGASADLRLNPAMLEHFLGLALPSH